MSAFACAVIAAAVIIVLVRKRKSRELEQCVSSCSAYIRDMNSS